MAPDLNKPVKEEGCFAVAFERKYYHRGDVFIKRSLRPREFRTRYHGLNVPRAGKERLLNEAASLRYIHEMTNIPVPTVYCDFEDDQASYLITEYIQGVSMSELTEEQKAPVFEEINEHLTTLRNLKSRNIGGPSGIVIPPYRALQLSDRDEYVFCHNGLSQQNIIVNLDTPKINAIIDWEYSGFYHDFFEAPFYTRLGPSAAIQGEVDDTPKLLEFLNSRQRIGKAILID
ncbi:kinase-like domain-containing protein [Rhexocercosporidium sp. MPI-PUGE-AT-0058]|nr:kinase-like domain-containing protein [Rhexocercosporidium sp. MPI-PUGE-AT-0058]